jgi:peptidoglycan/LPS O-acetylase OafA/YrhL
MDAVTLLKSMALLPQDPGIVGGTGAPVLIVAWSLQYEMVFYAFFGLLILNRVAGFAFAAGTFASAFAGHVLGWRLFLYFMNPVFFILFGFGLLIGLAAKAKLWTSYGRVAVLLGAAGLVATAIIANRTITTGLELIYGLGAGLLIFGLATMEGKRRFQIWKGWLLLGESSYVLYLIHFPIISVACKTAIAAGLAGFLGATITWVVTLAICVGAAVLVHIMAEKPMMTTARAVWGRTSFARPSSELRQTCRKSVQ